ncbi:FUSC family protein [Gordonia sp. NPDC003422]
MSSAPLVAWKWLPAAVAAVAVIPATAVAATGDIQKGAALAVGIIPAVAVGVARERKRRVVILIAGIILGLPILVGATVSPWPVVAVTTIFLLPILATWLAGHTNRPRLAMLLVVLAPPLVGVGFSEDGFSAGLTLTALFVAGSIATFVVAIVIPPTWIDEAAAGPAEPVSTPGLGYGLLVGVVGAITAGVGFALDFDHVGWACAAALLVMRPDADLQKWRTAGRFVSVTVGACVAAVMIELGAQVWLFTAAIALAIIAAAGTRGSRWYILPAFTTFLVITMLSYSTDTAGSRVAERIGETLFGLAVAAVVGLGIPAITRRVRHRPADASRLSD